MINQLKQYFTNGKNSNQVAISALHHFIFNKLIMQTNIIDAHELVDKASTLTDDDDITISKNECIIKALSLLKINDGLIGFLNRKTNKYYFYNRFDYAIDIFRCAEYNS